MPVATVLRRGGHYSLSGREFALCGGGRDGGNYAPQGIKDQSVIGITLSVIGITLLLVSVYCDAFTPNIQQRLDGPSIR